MSEEAVILHGAPTLAGIKTGSLFRCAYESIEAMRLSLREWNKRFSGKGLRVIPLSFENNKNGFSHSSMFFHICSVIKR